MNAAELKALQAPIKERYRKDPAAALITLRAQGRAGEGVACRVETGKGLIEAGLHPATGGSGLQACSGDMLLEALVACAGVTLKAVATALEFRLGEATVEMIVAAGGSAVVVDVNEQAGQTLAARHGDCFRAC